MRHRLNMRVCVRSPQDGIAVPGMTTLSHLATGNCRFPCSRWTMLDVKPQRPENRRFWKTSARMFQSDMTSESRQSFPAISSHANPPVITIDTPAAKNAVTISAAMTTGNSRQGFSFDDSSCSPRTAEVCQDHGDTGCQTIHERNQRL